MEGKQRRGFCIEYIWIILNIPLKRGLVTDGLTAPFIKLFYLHVYTNPVHKYSSM